MNLNVVTSLLENLWAAAAFNQYSNDTIEQPFSVEEVACYITENNLPFTIEDIENSIIYENVSLKDYVIVSVNRCFEPVPNILKISHKREEIVKGIAQYSECIKLTKSA